MYPSLSNVEKSTCVELFGMPSLRLISEMFHARLEELRNSSIANARSTEFVLAKSRDVAVFRVAAT